MEQDCKLFFGAPLRREARRETRDAKREKGEQLIRGSRLKTPRSLRWFLGSPLPARCFLASEFRIPNSGISPYPFSTGCLRWNPVASW